MTTETSAFFAARDMILDFADDPARSRDAFTQLDLGEHFNWAHDVFDVLAMGNDTAALRVLGPEGAEWTRSFAQVKERSDQVANWMRREGLSRGDIAMLMLDDQTEHWEIFLAALKLGVALVPTSVTFDLPELQDRVSRGKVTAVFAGPDSAVKLTRVNGNFRRVGVGLDEGTKDQRALLWDWARIEESRAASLAPIPKRTMSEDPAIIEFGSEATGSPENESQMHTHASAALECLTALQRRGAHRPGAGHFEIDASDGLERVWSSVFTTWSMGMTAIIHNGTPLHEAP